MVSDVTVQNAKAAGLMRVKHQTTLSTGVDAAGITLHYGAEARIVLHPAPAGTGIVFRRMDLVDSCGAPRPADETTIAAGPHSIADTRLGVRLQNIAGASVMTVEHLMAAFAISGVDNALIEVYGPEIPVFDGSTAPFLRLIAEAGVRQLGAPREAVIVISFVRKL